MSKRYIKAVSVTKSSDPNSKWLTAKQVCGVIGFSLVSFYKWREKFSDFPQPNDETGRYNIDEMRAWMDDHPDVGTPGFRVGAKREDLMCDNLAKRNALLDQQIAESEMRLVDGDRLIETFIRERTLNREAFRKRVLSEVPAEAEGKRAVQIAQLLQDAFDEYDKDVQASIPRIIRAKAV